MKWIKKMTIAGLASLLPALIPQAVGSLITVDSGATTPANLGTTLDSAGTIAAINVTPNPGWDPAAPQWVSDTANTGDPGDPNFVALPSGWSTFYHTFTLDPGEFNLLAANLTVWADDTANVVLNGTEIFAASVGPFTTCSSVAIGCLSTTKGVFGFADLAPFLNLGGVNQLEFNVFQATQRVSFGLAYSGSFETEDLPDTEVPEPGTAFLLGAGICAATLLRKRFSAKA